MIEDDFINHAVCKNCENFDSSTGECKERRDVTDSTKFIKTNPEDTCSFFSDRSKNDLEALREAFLNIQDIFKYYIDLNPEYYRIIALWVVGTYFYSDFPSYPYLYFNAMRGSGKSRTINLIKNLSWNGITLLNSSETSLFRSAGIHTLCFDEFESIGGKDKGIMRELLQAGYKQGGIVERFKQDPKSKEWKAEQFNVYSPKAMANIWGIEDVLADRCISLILEKSANPLKTKLIEDFENNETIKKTKMLLKKSSEQCSLCSVVSPSGHITTWNTYVNNNYTNNTHYTIHTNHTNYTNPLFDKILELNISGRDLEIWFPLITIQENLEPENLDSLFKTIQNLVSAKKEDDVYENKDISLYKFIGEELSLEYGLNLDSFISVEYLINKFKEFLGSSEEWLNVKWMGRALKRLNLVKEKRRVSRGIEVLLDFSKAKEKIKIFK